jgi:nucleolin
VFVGRLSYNVDHAWLKEEFEACGEVVSSRIIVDRDGGSRGFGYVEFNSPEAAQEALKLDGKEIDGRPVRVDLSTPRPAPGQNTAGGRTSRTSAIDLPPSPTIYVGNLAFTTTEAAIRDHFSSYGQILSVRLPVDGVTGRPRGFGYVEFGTEAEAVKVVDISKSEPIGLDGRNLRIGFSAPRTNVGGAGAAGRSYGGANTYGGGSSY